MNLIQPKTSVRMTRAGLARTLQTSDGPERGIFIRFTHDPGSSTYRRLAVVEGIGRDGKRHRGTYLADSWERLPTGVKT